MSTTGSSGDLDLLGLRLDQHMHWLWMPVKEEHTLFAGQICDYVREKKYGS